MEASAHLADPQADRSSARGRGRPGTALRRHASTSKRSFASGRSRSPTPCSRSPCPWRSRPTPGTGRLARGRGRRAHGDRRRGHGVLHHQLPGGLAGHATGVGHPQPDRVGARRCVRTLRGRPGLPGLAEDVVAIEVPRVGKGAVRCVRVARARGERRVGVDERRCGLHQEAGHRRRIDPEREGGGGGGPVVVGYSEPDRVQPGRIAGGGEGNGLIAGHVGAVVVEIPREGDDVAVRVAGARPIRATTGRRRSRAPRAPRVPGDVGGGKVTGWPASGTSILAPCRRPLLIRTLMPGTGSALTVKVCVCRCLARLVSVTRSRTVLVPGVEMSVRSSRRRNRQRLRRCPGPSAIVRCRRCRQDRWRSRPEVNGASSSGTNGVTLKLATGGALLNTGTVRVATVTAPSPSVTRSRTVLLPPVG